MPNNPRAVENLKKIKPGQVLNPNGRPKGSKNLSTIVKELEDENFDWSKMPEKQIEAITKLGAPWKAITYAAVGNAIAGDIRAAEWLRKAGYGDKIDITSNGESIQPVMVKFVDADDTDS
jgi:hypothetical protein